MALKDDIREGSNGDRDAGLTRIYGAAPREAPPAHLDVAILAAARREAGVRPRSLSALRAWRVPVGIAAVVVLSVSLVTLVREEGGEALYRPVPPDVPRTAEPEPRPSGDAPEPALAKPPVRPGAPRSAAPADRAPDTRDRVAEAPQPAREAGRGQPPEAASRPPQPFQGALESAGERPATPPGSADDAARAKETIPERSLPPATVFDRAPSAPMTAPSPEAPPRATAEAKGAAPAPARAPAAKAMRGERDMGVREDAQSTAGVGPAQRQEVRGALASQPQVAAILKELDTQPPEKWLERIHALRREGQAAEAREVLAQFKRRYPAHPLPPELQ